MSKLQYLLQNKLNTDVQRAKKLASDSPGLVDFAIRLVNSVLNLPDGQVKIFEEFKLHKNCVINPAYQNDFGAIVEMNFGLVHASYSPNGNL